MWKPPNPRQETLSLVRPNVRYCIADKSLLTAIILTLSAHRESPWIHTAGNVSDNPFSALLLGLATFGPGIGVRRSDVAAGAVIIPGFGAKFRAARSDTGESR